MSLQRAAQNPTFASKMHQVSSQLLEVVGLFHLKSKVETVTKTIGQSNTAGTNIAVFDKMSADNVQQNRKTGAKPNGNKQQNRFQGNGKKPAAKKD
jgi:hypothetical protein